MFIILFGLILAIFWYQAIRVQPNKYPNAKPGDVLAWQAIRIKLYRKYAASLLLIFILQITSGFLGHWYLKTLSQTALILTYGVVFLYLILTILLLIFIIYRFFKLRTWCKQSGIPRL